VIWRRVAGTPGFEGEILHDPVGSGPPVISGETRGSVAVQGVGMPIERAALLPALSVNSLTTECDLMRLVFSLFVSASRAPANPA
jgi:hypothetical protein